MSDAAPNVCPECGEPAYVGMTDVECTWFFCRHYHRDTADKHLEEVSPVPVDEDAPKKQPGVYSDYCSTCNQRADFERWKYPDGRLSAWCPWCGQPNYWAAEKPKKPVPTGMKAFTKPVAHYLFGNKDVWGDEDTEPGNGPSIDEILKEFNDTSSAD